MLIDQPLVQSEARGTNSSLARGSEDCIVTLFTTGMPDWSNSMPQSRSIQGKAFSCPTATSTSSHS